MPEEKKLSPIIERLIWLKGQQTPSFIRLFAAVLLGISSGYATSVGIRSSSFFVSSTGGAEMSVWVGILGCPMITDFNSLLRLFVSATCEWPSRTASCVYLWNEGDSCLMSWQCDARMPWTVRYSFSIRLWCMRHWLTFLEAMSLAIRAKGSQAALPRSYPHSTPHTSRKARQRRWQSVGHSLAACLDCLEGKVDCLEGKVDCLEGKVHFSRRKGPRGGREGTFVREE